MDVKWDKVPDPGERYKLGKCLGQGVFGRVLEAEDEQAGRKKIAVKILQVNDETRRYVEEEYKVLRDLSGHPNLPDFYGIYRTTKDCEEIWFVMELCECGSVMDLVQGLQVSNRRMAEEHIAFILKEVIKALVHLHDNLVIHRAIRGSNILLTRLGEVKLIDFGLSHSVEEALAKRSTYIGCPYWMAPEIVSESSYDSRADVWALGITAIELGDGHSPYQDLHPTRALFQIVRNPPPGLNIQNNWSENYNDFISECLEKNPDFRPFAKELLDHPFVASVPENDYHLTRELLSLVSSFGSLGKDKKLPESIIKNNLLKSDPNGEFQKMHVEDLASVENTTESNLLSEIRERFKMGNFYNFVGDTLLALNPNEEKNIYEDEYHLKYKFKSRSDNAPHIYAVADSAYQNVLHHEVPQYVLLTGESGSGKSTAAKHVLDHLLFLGRSLSPYAERVQKVYQLLQAFTSGTTPMNHNATRGIISSQITFSTTGKVSGGTFGVWFLEKSRVSSMDMNQSNFHIFYYFRNSIEASESTESYFVEPGINYRYLRYPDNFKSTSEANIKKFEEVVEILTFLEFSNEQIDLIRKVLSSVLLIGEIKFENSDDFAVIENVEYATKVAELLQVDPKKFSWALTNYCAIEQGVAIRRRYNCDQARSIRDTLANNLYSKLIDWIVHFMNCKLSYGRAILGEKYSITIIDIPGFECFKTNSLEQLLINSLNEQIQYFYIQRVFEWEYMEIKEDDIPLGEDFTYYSNKFVIDHVLKKPEGVLMFIDDASKTGHGGNYITDSIICANKTPYVTSVNNTFTVAHYTGRVTYNVQGLAEKNRDFLSPDVIEVLRMSDNRTIKDFFANKTSNTGNVAFPFDNSGEHKKEKWSADLKSEHERIKRTWIEGQYSQTRRMRTTINTFKSISLHLLKQLSVASGSGVHFVRCISTSLKKCPQEFHEEVVRQQLRAMSVLDTVKVRQIGYSYRVNFHEFLKRYKFLAFDFNETVDVTKENCRLLLVRLKMDGWMTGNTKVFLKYYNEEYLARLYETQVQKITKIQSMMRAFIAKRNFAKMIKFKPVLEEKTEPGETSAEAAAILIQKAFRGYITRKVYGPLINKNTGKLDEETADFIRPYFKKWKNKSIFQVLLQYRAVKFQDLVNFSQQVHIYNQSEVLSLQEICEHIDVEKVDTNAQITSWLGDKKPTVWKTRFRFDQLPYFNTMYMCDPLTNPGSLVDDQDLWDTPFLWRQKISQNGYSDTTPPVDINYNRDPAIPVETLAVAEMSPILSPKKIKSVPSTPKKSPIKKPPSPKADAKAQLVTNDFEFIRSPPVLKSKLKRSPSNPITELESIGRKYLDKKSEDDPPFNFQAMLRKTNYRRDSLKRNEKAVNGTTIEEAENQIPCKEILIKTATPEVIVEDTSALEDILKVDTQIVVNGKNEEEKILVADTLKECPRKDLSDEIKVNGETCQEVSTEIAPGIILQGILAEL